MRHKARLLQGGFTWRKSWRWCVQIHRFKGRMLLLGAVGIAPFYVELKKLSADMIVPLYFWWTDLFRPETHFTYNLNARAMTMFETKPMTPPHYDINYFQQEWYENVLVSIRERKQFDFRNAHRLDIVRNSGFVHHPSRETSAIVEGALLQEEQNQLVDNLRYRIAEEMVSKGVWKSVEEAYSEGLKIRRQPRPQN
mmetsp:Transcript_15708/g.28684  ORF Transcript_15708/g.28684 Transcript_15708/m.28684 type:complete len:196 (-) Transcript_15708:2047-2634(-)